MVLCSGFPTAVPNHQLVLEFDQGTPKNKYSPYRLPSGYFRIEQIQQIICKPQIQDHPPFISYNMSELSYIYIHTHMLMYGIFTNIYPKNHPNVGNYTIHGAYGIYIYIYISYIHRIPRMSHIIGSFFVIVCAAGCEGAPLLAQGSRGVGLGGWSWWYGEKIRGLIVVE